MDNFKVHPNRMLCITFFAFVLVFGVVGGFKFARYRLGMDVYNEYWTAQLGGKLETDYNTSFFMKRRFIDLNGAIRLAMGQRKMNRTLRLNNTYLTFPRTRLDDSQLISWADNVSFLEKYLNDKGIEFLYVCVPNKIAKYDNEIPVGEHDYSNDNTDVFINELYVKGVNYIDLREELYKDGLNHYEYFYRTDHHWNTRGAFYAYGKIARWLKEHTDYDFDYRIGEMSSYDSKLYKGINLGTAGQRCGQFFGGVDDIELFLPKFTTDIYSADLRKSGSFEEIFLNLDELDVVEPSFLHDRVFRGQGNFTNNLAENSITMLILDDSFGRDLNPYFVLSVNHVYWNTSYAGNYLTEEYINEINPNIVLLIQSTENTFHENTRAYEYGFLKMTPIADGGI